MVKIDWSEKMILKLIDDIRKALDCELYFVALNTALSLPDICGKVAYPDERSSRKRYINWYEEEIGQYEKIDESMPYLSGEVLYSLRCSLVHEGNPNMQNRDLNKDKMLDYFCISIQKPKPSNIYLDSSIVVNLEDETIQIYRLNLVRICLVLCKAVESYYKVHKESFYFNYEIIDWDEGKVHLSSTDMEDIFCELAKNDENIYQERTMDKNA